MWGHLGSHGEVRLLKEKDGPNGDLKDEQQLAGQRGEGGVLQEQHGL